MGRPWAGSGGGGDARGSHGVCGLRGGVWVLCTCAICCWLFHRSDRWRLVCRRTSSFLCGR